MRGLVTESCGERSSEAADRAQLVVHINGVGHGSGQSTQVGWANEQPAQRSTAWTSPNTDLVPQHEKCFFFVKMLKISKTRWKYVKNGLSAIFPFLHMFFQDRNRILYPAF